MPIKKMPDNDTKPYLGEKKVKKQNPKVSHAKKTKSSSLQHPHVVDAKIVSAPEPEKKDVVKKIPHTTAADLFSLPSQKKEKPSPSRKKAEKVFSRQEKKGENEASGKTQSTQTKKKKASSSVKNPSQSSQKKISSPPEKKEKKTPVVSPPVITSSSSHGKKKIVPPTAPSDKITHTNKRKHHYDENSTLNFFQATEKHRKKHSLETLNTQPPSSHDQGSVSHAQIPEIKRSTKSETPYPKRIIIREEDLNDFPPVSSARSGVNKIFSPAKKSVYRFPFIVGLIFLCAIVAVFQLLPKHDTVLPTSQVTTAELSSFDPTPDPVPVQEKTLASSSSSTESDIHFVIQPGMGAQAVCTALSALGFDGESLLSALLDQGLEGAIVSGTYLLQSTMTTSELINTICSSKQVNITIFAGMSIAEIDSSLVHRGWIESGDFLHACTQLCATYGLSFVEGWFASGVYTVDRTDIATSLSSQMFEKLLSLLSPHLTTIAESGYRISDVLIIATLIQAETQNPDQMGLISSVIYNRLTKNMALGIDATTRYETGNKTDPLSLEVLNTITPYNTRRKKGLVPSGICCPSIDAIEAAVHPETTQYLYYLHKSDKSIVMATTYEEHKENIKESQNEV